MAASHRDDDDSRETRASAARSSSKGTISDDVWNEAVNDWINTSLRNSDVSSSTEAWNHLLNTAIPAFRKILESKI